ncbi:MAG: hypothetical protein KBS76_03505 [Ruminococcus sp.]|nr:hypothetical protein [Candidatus Apopatosoma intestinale]
MMKTVRRVLGCLLILGITLSVIGCTPSKKIQNNVLSYLQDKYGDELSFEYIDYTQDKGASGRYEVDARCTTDGTEFQIYVYSSLFITDSYSVVLANGAMDKAIRELFLTKDYSFYIEKITWKNLFEDGTTDYRFRTVEHPNIVDIREANRIYRVTLTPDHTPEQYISWMFNFLYDMKDSGAEVEDISFEFPYGDDTFIVHTDYATIAEFGFGQVLYKIVPVIEEEAARPKNLFSIDDVITIEMRGVVEGTENSVIRTVG